MILRVWWSVGLLFQPRSQGSLLLVPSRFEGRGGENPENENLIVY